jgi:GTP-binding protein EngB required for normal cell division
MNENHQRRLVATFRYIDNVLGETGYILAAADASSPFAQYTQDASPVQRKVIDDYIRRVREVIGRVMTDLNLPRPAPVCGTLWAAQASITSAKIAVAEMRPKHMLGYGELIDADIRAITDIVAELDAALERLMSYVAQGSDADLPARLQKLEQTRDDVALLRELERIVTAHGLVALRGTLSMLLDRLENDRFEIGVFGRTSSGKSSLLNQLFGVVVLPVGVTPVTAVPTRVQFGAASRATVEFAQNPPVVVELARLAEFSTEQQNPANGKHVTRIVVEVPAARLREGVTWVDTPGLGSLATSGAAETTAYLPRCDLGLVLVDAGATLTQEDLVLLQMLLHSGAQAMVLVSKADLLKSGDRERFVDYIRKQFATQFGEAPPVFLISVRGADAALCDEWFDQALQPLLESHREQAAASLKRKVGLLREAAARTLEARLMRPPPGAVSPSDQIVEEAIAALRRAEGLCAAAERAADDLVDALPHLREALIQAASAEVVVVWQQTQTAPNFAAEACRTTLERTISIHTGKVLQVLAVLRQQLDEALRQGQQALPAVEISGESLPQASGAPLFDAVAAIRQVNLDPPALLWFLPAPLLLHFARTRLQEQWRNALEALLNDYSRRLRQWLRTAVAELTESFRAHAAPVTTQLEARATAPAAGNIAETEAALRRLRELDSAARPT